MAGVSSFTPIPDRSLERGWQARGCTLVAGVDEVGRGPIAGPVVAGAVILPPDRDPSWLDALRDSKQLSPGRREQLADAIWTEALAAAIGVVPARRIDEIGIAPAAREAMRQAVRLLRPMPHALLLDAFRLPEVDLPQEPVIRGDALCSSVAAASIVAKVARDRIMAGLAARYPPYGFDQHRGYATAGHLRALGEHGACPIHRRSFAPLRTNGEADCSPS